MSDTRGQPFFDRGDKRNSQPWQARMRTRMAPDGTPD
jgi:hypothetical protein